MIVAPQRFPGRDQPPEVACRSLVARCPRGRQQAFRGDPAPRALHPLGHQLDDRVVVAPARRPRRWPTAGLMAGNHPLHRLRCGAANRSRATVRTHLSVGGNDVHPFPRRLQWSPLGGAVTGSHRHRHRPGPTLRVDTTNEGWGLLTGHQRGPTPGHQRGLSHGHGQPARRWWQADRDGDGSAQMCARRACRRAVDPLRIDPLRIGMSFHAWGTKILGRSLKLRGCVHARAATAVQPQFKADAVQMVIETGKPIAEVAADLGIRDLSFSR